MFCMQAAVGGKNGGRTRRRSPPGGATEAGAGAVSPRQRQDGRLARDASRVEQRPAKVCGGPAAPPGGEVRTAASRTGNEVRDQFYNVVCGKKINMLNDSS